MNCQPEHSESWQGPCQKELAQRMEVESNKLLNGTYIKPGDISQPGLDWARQQMYQAMYHHHVGSVNSETEQAFYRICQSVPGLCQQYLSDRCINQTPVTLARLPYQVYWCGCHLQEDHYQEIFNKYGVSPECHSMCARKGNVPMVNPDLSRQVCEQNVCIMDNNMLVLNQGQGTTKFNQYCGGCANTSQSGCNCLISSNNVVQTMQRLNGPSASIEQVCGSTKCFIPGDNPGEVKEVPCQLKGSSVLGQDKDDLVTTASTIKSNWSLVVFILILLMIVVIIIVCLIVSWLDLGKCWNIGTFEHIRSSDKSHLHRHNGYKGSKSTQ